MSDDPVPAPDELIRRVRERTPARILVGRAGPAYPTATWLKLREDHAAALDAVQAELELPREFVEQFELFEVQTQAASKQQYLLRPDLGRRLNAAARESLPTRCIRGADAQITIGDGLSAAAVIAQVPTLLPLLMHELAGLRISKPFVVRHARVGVMNDIGELLQIGVVILLIGERPGLATAESLSAYLAYRPGPGQTDADRNLISNIHARGVPVECAARRIAALCRRMLTTRSSGFGLKEEMPGLQDGNAKV